jgi:PAS domain S-box-containing protein
MSVNPPDLLAAILNSAVGAIVTIDERASIQLVNPAAERLFGYAATELIGQNVKLLMPEPYRSEHDRYVRAHLDTGARRIIGIGREVEGRRKDGSVFPVHLSVSAFAVGGRRYFAGIMHDLSEHSRVRGALRRQETIFEAVFNSVPEGLLLSDESGTITLCNAAVANIFGWAPDDLLGTPTRDLFASEADYALSRPSPPGAPVRPMRVGLRRRAGESFTGEIIAASIAEVGGTPLGVLRIVRDLTGKLDRERVLRHAQRMESVGQLTGGIAHDFNNLLTVIGGNLELLEMRLKDAKERELLRRALEAAEMGARLTGRLLLFARRGPVRATRLDLNALVTGMADLLQRAVGEAIGVTTALAPGLWPIEADASEIENAIINLALNARDAMPGGGTITIETANVAGGGESLTGDGPAVDRVRLSARDTGAGMTPEVARRAFEPFFTTKPPGKGTGLGLSSVYGLARQLGGDVSLASAPGRGTTVTIELPRLGINADAAAAALPMRGVAAGMPPAKASRSCWSRTTTRCGKSRARAWSSSAIR